MDKYIRDPVHPTSVFNCPQLHSNTNSDKVKAKFYVLQQLGRVTLKSKVKRRWMLEVGPLIPSKRVGPGAGTFQSRWRKPGDMLLRRSAGLRQQL